VSLILDKQNNKQPEKKSNPVRTAVEFIVLLVVIMFGTYFIVNNVVSKDIVSGTSMQPTLEDGDRLWSLRHRGIKRNDIVVIHAPDREGELYIKRVIGMPGDTVESKNDVLYVNGKKQAQPYLKSSFMKTEIASWAQQQNVDPSSIKFTGDFNIATLPSTKRKTVPAGHYFVMGDNRLVSHDGRDFGFISKSKVQSVVAWRYWPLNKMKFY